VTRRDVLRIGAAVGALSATVPGRTARAAASTAPTTPEPGPAQSPAAEATPDFAPEFIVVGSGAGGGTVAARLAESGFRVLLLEAGGDPRTLEGANPLSGGRNTLPEDYDVPAFHPLATENAALRWDFFVRHYTDDARQRRDPKYCETFNGARVDGVWYPRAGTLGGCTAHNAMILIYPHAQDWNELADLTGDRSWEAARMRTYFERLENCHYRPVDRWLGKAGLNPSGHGWSGWLHTEHAVPRATIRQRDLRTVLLESIREGFDQVGLPDRARRASLGDPNDARVVRDGAAGLRFTPLTTHNHVRVGTRERVLDVQQRHPDRLRIETDALVTRVLFDDTQRAVGVEYRRGARLYRAHPRPGDAEGELRQAHASREVILSGGAFNTPQLLMLSGIGPRATLERHGIPIRVDLPGVGQNLRDRYEVAVVNRMAFDAWAALDGATFLEGDAQFRAWQQDRDGVYTTNGTMLSVISSSSPGRPSPDLFCYAVLGKFSGYVPDYSTLLPANPNCLTWVVLKGHTNNTAGEVTLRSADPRTPPQIAFRYFEEGNDASGDDLSAVVQAVKLVRRMAAKLKRDGLIAREEMPGDAVVADEDLKTFVRDHAWGHHASCTCRIGPRETGGVLSSDFKVHGTTALRVVDASVFPRTPGLFIVSAVYMIGEKAADVIAAEAARSPGRPSA
jgi:choline dehydrogenase-like flavoprotein